MATQKKAPMYYYGMTNYYGIFVQREDSGYFIIVGDCDTYLGTEKPTQATIDRFAAEVR